MLQPAISSHGFNDRKKVYFIIYGGSNRDVCASSQLPSYATEGIIANTAALYYPGKRSGSCIDNNGGFKPEFNETAKAALRIDSLQCTALNLIASHTTRSLTRSLTLDNLNKRPGFGVGI